MVTSPVVIDGSADSVVTVIFSLSLDNLPTSAEPEYTACMLEFSFNQLSGTS